MAHDDVSSLRELLDPEDKFRVLTDIEFVSISRIVFWDDVTAIADSRLVGYRTVTEQLHEARQKIRMLAALEYGQRLGDAKAVYRFFLAQLVLPRLFPPEAA